MNIRARLTASFLAILLLFAINIGVYYWGGQQKKSSLLEIRQALSQAQLITSIDRDLEERRKEVGVLAQLAESGSGALTQAQVGALAERLTRISEMIGQLNDISDHGLGEEVGEVSRRYTNLRSIWREKYESFVNGSGLPADSAQPTGADTASLADSILTKLHDLEAGEQRRIDDATARFNRLADLTDRISLSLFVVTSVVAIAVALLFSRWLTKDLDALRLGAGRIGEGDLQYRLVVRSQDELGVLAGAFNTMSEKLHLAHDRLTETNHQLERQNREIEQQQVKLAQAIEEAHEARASAEEANRAKSTFLANMSHELRTPMNAIIGYSEMLLEDAADLGVESAEPDLRKIHAAGKHLLQLINDVLDLSKIEAGRTTLFLETFDGRVLVDEAVATAQPLADRNDNQLVVRVSPEFGSMYADELKVRQSLLNLLSNACKFTKSGTVTLDVHLEELENGRSVVFDVSDTGIGMNAEQMSRLFQVFSQADASTTRKFGGTGLGLVISRTFCRLMGGDIKLSSELGKGSTFRIELPLRQQEASLAEAPVTMSESSALSEGGPVVLVVDDDPHMRDLATRSLTKSGYRTVTAASGKQALEIARTVKPTIITLDIALPDTTGWQVLTALKADPDTASIPVIMMSALDARQAGLGMGASEYLIKPIDPTKLAGALQRVIRESAAGSVLIVGNDAAANASIRVAMERESWMVAEAADGDEALRTTAESVPDLILLVDSTGMDGLEVLRALRASERLRSVTVVVVTTKDISLDERLVFDGFAEQVVQMHLGDRQSVDDLTELVLKCARQEHLIG